MSGHQFRIKINNIFFKFYCRIPVFWDPVFGKLENICCNNKFLIKFMVPHKRFQPHGQSITNKRNNNVKLIRIRYIYRLPVWRSPDILNSKRKSRMVISFYRSQQVLFDHVIPGMETCTKISPQMHDKNNLPGVNEGE